VCVCVANRIEKEDFLLSPESHNISRNIFALYFTTKPATNFHCLLEHCQRNREYCVAFSPAMETQTKVQIAECYECGRCILELFVTLDLAHSLQIVTGSVKVT
jgi:hypothetical protein